MPGLDLHAYTDRACFGKSYYKIHREMDWPYKIFGRKHRQFYHDPISAAIIAEECYPGDPDAVEAALLHILLDKTCSANPEFKKLLKQCAILDKRKRGRKNKAEPKLEIEKRLMKDMKNLAELRKWLSIIYSNY